MNLKGGLVELVLVAYLLFFLFSSVQGYILTQSGPGTNMVKGYSSSGTANGWYPGSLGSSGEFTFTVHRDTVHQDDALVFHTVPSSSGSGTVDISSIPSGSVVSLSQSSGEFKLSQNPEGQWSWSSSDEKGGILKLPDDWTSVKFTPSGVPDVWFRGSNKVINLDDSNTVTVKRQAPYKPDNPSPNDGASISSSSTTLSAHYQDPNGDSGQLHFYDNNDNLIGSCSVSSDSRCSVTWSGLDHGDQKWYAVADDGSNYNTKGPKWMVTRNNPPSKTTDPTNPTRGEKVYGRSVDLKMPASDPDGDSTTTEFHTNITGTVGSDSGTSPSVTLNNLQRGETYEWWGVVSDPWDSTESSHWKFWVNNLPSTSKPKPSDDGVAVGSPIDMSIKVNDPDPGDKKLNVYFMKASDDSLIAKDGNVDSGSRAQGQENFLGIGQTLRWYVKVSDKHENMTSPTYTFTRLSSENFRVTTGIEYKYSSVIVDPNGVKDVTFKVTNNANEMKNLKTMLGDQVKSYFMDNTRVKTYSLASHETKTISIRIAPDGSAGLKHLKVTTENQEIKVNSTTEIPVLVRKYPAVAGVKQVPGIGIMQLTVLTGLSTLLYSLLL